MEKAIYTTLDTILNVKMSVPSVGAMWLVGVLNINSGEIVALGKGKNGVYAGLNFKPSLEEVIIYTVGLVVKYQGKTVIVNRTYSGLGAEDFGKNSNFTAEVKNKRINERDFTSLSLTKTPGSWSHELKFSDDGSQPVKDGQKDYQIVGTSTKIVITPLHQSHPASQPA